MQAIAGRVVICLILFMVEPATLRGQTAADPEIMAAGLWYIQGSTQHNNGTVFKVDPRIFQYDGARVPRLEESAQRHDQATLSKLHKEKATEVVSLEKALQCRVNAPLDCMNETGRSVVMSLGRPTVRGDSATFHVLMSASGLPIEERWRNWAYVGLVTVVKVGGKWIGVSLRTIIST